MVAAIPSYYLTTLNGKHVRRHRGRRSNPDENEVETPFTLKALSSDPYRNSKARGKLIEFYYDKPHAPKETEIPKDHPAMSPQPETVVEVGLSGGQW